MKPVNAVQAAVGAVAMAAAVAVAVAVATAAAVVATAVPAAVAAAVVAAAAAAIDGDSRPPRPGDQPVMASALQSGRLNTVTCLIGTSS
jgi:hypothetical protein